MRVVIYRTDLESGRELVENIRHTDEVAESESYSDEEANQMEILLRQRGIYYLGNDRFIMPFKGEEPAR